MAIGGKIGVPDVQPYPRYIFSLNNVWSKRTDLLLFLGETQNIRDGKLYNQMVGSSDYLIATGNNFQCPDNQSYRDADNDNIWFLLSSLIRSPTESELIGYDFERTIIYYEDNDPFTLRIIAILKPIVLIPDTMRKDFRLSLWWDDTFSDYGYTKANRGAGKNIWTPL